jgi:hypothetical protein
VKLLLVGLKGAEKLISEKIINPFVRALRNMIFLLSYIQLTHDEYIKTRGRETEDISSHKNILYSFSNIHRYLQIKRQSGSQDYGNQCQ